jgi:hypothetical protein
LFDITGRSVQIGPMAEDGLLALDNSTTYRKNISYHFAWQQTISKDLEELFTICFKAAMSFFNLEITLFFLLRASCNSTILYMQTRNKEFTNTLIVYYLKC